MEDWKDNLEHNLKALATLLRDEKTISAYEVHLSRLVPVLLYCLTGTRGDTTGSVVVGGCGGPEREKSKVKERVKLFKRVFAEAADELPADHPDSR